MNSEFVFQNNNNKMLDDLLNTEYHDILKEIKQEEYNLEFMEFDIFYEIHFENKIVGFITFKKNPINRQSFCNYGCLYYSRIPWQ